MALSAKMIVKNQTKSRIATTLSNVTCMYLDPIRFWTESNLQIFNNLALDSYKSSDWVYIEADKRGTCFRTQSSFQINYLNGSIGIGSIGIDIGLPVYRFKTAVTSNTNPPQIQAVLAPKDPLVTGFEFYLYAGPGVLAPLVQSVIGANLDALTRAISQHPLTGDITIGVDFSALSCPYAAAVPTGPNILGFSAILSTSVTVSGKLRPDLPLKNVLFVTDLILLIEGTIDLSSKQPKISLTLLKCSLGSYWIDPLLLKELAPFIEQVPIIGTLLGIITFALIALAQAAVPPNVVAGTINGTDLNKKILDAINEALRPKPRSL